MLKLAFPRDAGHSMAGNRQVGCTEIEIWVGFSLSSNVELLGWLRSLLGIFAFRGVGGRLWISNECTDAEVLTQGGEFRERSIGEHSSPGHAGGIYGVSLAPTLRIFNTVCTLARVNVRVVFQ